MSSRLLLLPCELRHQILRLLLSGPEPLACWQNLNYEDCIDHRLRRNHDHPNSISSLWSGLRQRNFHFEPQVLRVCRQLHQKGTNVLYDDNALVIHVLDDPGHAKLYVEALGHDQWYFRSKARSIMCDETKPMEEWLLGTERTIKHFQLDVQIPLDGYDSSGLTWKTFKHHIMPLLGPELGSASLKINIELPKTDEYDDILDGNMPSIECILEQFNILHEYRCKELIVTMNGEPYYPAWAKSMTSKEPIFLLSNSYRRLIDFIRNSTRQTLSWPMMHGLFGAMSAWDVERFKDARQMALREHKKQHEAEISRFKSEISRYEEAIEVIEEESQAQI